MRTDKERLLQWIDERKTLRLLCFGENHFHPNYFRDFISAVLPELQGRGFNVIAVELNRGMDAYLQQSFRDKTPIAEVQAQFPSTVSKSPQGKNIPMPASYFAMIRDFAAAGGRVVPVDVMVGNRDLAMGEKLCHLLTDRESKVIYWAGSLHVFRRTHDSNRGTHRSAIEVVADLLNVDNMFSIAQVARTNDPHGDAIAAGFEGLIAPKLFSLNELRKRLGDGITDSFTGVKTLSTGEHTAVRFDMFDGTYWCPEPVVTQDNAWR